MSTETPLLQFPCEFPLKVFGAAIPEFAAAVQLILHRHVSQQDIISFNIRASKGHRYHAITFVIMATSKAQLDALYQDLTSHELVVMAL